MILSAKGFRERDIRWHFSLARTYAYLHAARLHDGEEMVWPSQRLAVIRHQQEAWQRFHRYRELTASK